MTAVVLVGVALVAYWLYIKVSRGSVVVMIALVAALLNIPLSRQFTGSTGLTLALVTATFVVFLSAILSSKYRRVFNG